MNMCKCVQVPSEARGIQCPQTWTYRGCEVPGVNGGTKHGFSLKAVYALNCSIISLAPKIFSSYIVYFSN